MDALTISVASALIGPIAAVVITVAWQHADRDYQRRLHIFQTLMRYRRHQLNAEWVGAFNLVPVEFAKRREVIESFNRLLDRYSDPSWRGTPQQAETARDNVDMAASELLHRMATSLRIDLKGLDLRRAYAPQGWATDEDSNKAMRFGVLELLAGRLPIRVRLDDNQPPSPPPPEPTPPL